MRTKFIAGNWKMNPATVAEAVALAEAVKAGVGPEGSVFVALCPAALHLTAVDRALENAAVSLGAQDLSWEAAGAFTGELSAAMLLDAGCTHVIIGHSERRHGRGETDEQVNKKLHAALKAQLIPILCLGETLPERESDRTEAVLEAQLVGSLAGLTGEQMAGVVLAYEPVWAIGTGRTASPDQAQQAHAFIRSWLGQSFGAAIAARVTIQYGGSVKPSNAAELMAQPDVDGALVGGASLVAEDFVAIVRAARPVR